MNCAFCITYKNICLTQDHKDFLLFLSKSFIILGFYIQVLIHFELIFAGKIQIEDHVLVYGYPIVPTSSVKWTTLSLHQIAFVLG